MWKLIFVLRTYRQRFTYKPSISTPPPRQRVCCHFFPKLLEISLIMTHRSCCKGCGNFLDPNNCRCSRRDFSTFYPSYRIVPPAIELCASQALSKMYLTRRFQSDVFDQAFCNQSKGCIFSDVDIALASELVAHIQQAGATMTLRDIFYPQEKSQTSKSLSHICLFYNLDYDVVS